MDLDQADALMARVAAETLSPSARLRHAEILFTRAAGDDRQHAAAFYSL